jgi:hypothetical protein
MLSYRRLATLPAQVTQAPHVPLHVAARGLLKARTMQFFLTQTPGDWLNLILLTFAASLIGAVLFGTF